MPAEIGHPYSLTCIVRCDQTEVEKLHSTTYEYNWKQRIRDGNPPHPVDNSRTTDPSTLSFNQLRYSNKGIYTCEVTIRSEYFQSESDDPRPVHVTSSAVTIHLNGMLIT